MQLVVIRIGPGNFGNSLRCVVPGAAPVAVEVRVLLELGIGVGREHLAVGVDGDALALGLLEQLLEVEQVVAGDQDGFARLDAQRHLGGHRRAEGLGVGLVEQFHGLVVHLAAAQGFGQPVVQVALVVAGEVGQRFDVVVVDGLVACSRARERGERRRRRP